MMQVPKTLAKVTNPYSDELLLFIVVEQEVTDMERGPFKRGGQKFTVNQVPTTIAGWIVYADTSFTHIGHCRLDAKSFFGGTVVRTADIQEVHVLKVKGEEGMEL